MALFLLAPALLVARSAPSAYRQVDVDGLGTNQEPASAGPPQQPELPFLAQALESSLATLHGVVRNAATGEPLPRALVRIEGDADTGALTDGDGRFEIPGVPVGPQAIQVRKPGFRDHPFEIGEEPGGPEGPSHNVLVAPEMGDVVFKLAPTGAIQGQIDLSTGEPAQRIAIRLIRRIVQDGRAVWQEGGETKTSSEGKFRFAGLPDGTYTLFTQPAMESEPAFAMAEPGGAATTEHEGYPSVYYPDARDPSGAASIRLRGGQQAQANMTLALEPFHAVSATVKLPREHASTGAPPIYSGLVMDTAGHQLPYTSQYDMQSHTIQTLLPDGNYMLLVTAIPTLNLNRQANNGGGADPDAGPLVGIADFAVAGHAITNLRVPLSVPHPSPVQLTLSRSGAQATQGQNSPNMVLVSRAAGWIDDMVMAAYANGTGPGPMETVYTMPGPYWVHTQVGQKGYCESSFTAGGINLAREPVIISLSGSTAPMDLTLRDDCATLTVSLPQNLASLMAGEEPFYSVFVIPDFDSTRDVQPITLRMTSGGSGTLEDLTPGNYHVYTFAGAMRLEYHNPAALAALPRPGQAVTLSPGATTELVLEAPGR